MCELSQLTLAEAIKGVVTEFPIKEGQEDEDSAPKLVGCHRLRWKSGISLRS